MSDTHGEHHRLQVPAGDILIHAGDLSYGDDLQGLLACLDWFASQPHPCKILIAGNHDRFLDPPCFRFGHTGLLRQQEEVREAMRRHIKRMDFIYLQHETVEVSVNGRKLKVFGSPYTPEHGPGAFRYKAHEDIWGQSIPSDADLVVVHGPPQGILDRSRKGAICGCAFLARRLQKVQPKLVVFGHIHESFGVERRTWNTGQETCFANAAVGFPLSISGA